MNISARSIRHFVKRMTLLRENFNRAYGATLRGFTLATLLIVFTMIIGGNAAQAHGSTPPTAGHADEIVLGGTLPGKLDLTPYLSWYVDKSKQMPLEAVRTLSLQDFSQSKGIPSFGYTTNIIWYRVDFSVDQVWDARPLIEVQPNYLNFIDMYLFKETQSAKGTNALWHTSMGDHIPSSQRPYKGESHVADLPQLDTGSYQLFIRVQSNSANLLTLTLWQSNDLISSITRRNLVANVFFGIFISIGISYFILGLIARDAVVVTYGLWIASVGMVISIVDGFGLSHLRPEVPWINDLILGGSNIISQAVGIFLWLHIMDFRNRAPKVFWLGMVYCAVILSFIVGTTNDLYTIFGAYIAPSVSVFMACMCLVLVKRLIYDFRNPALWAYLVALALPSTAAIMLQLSHTGWIQATPLTLGLHQFTFIFHVFAMGLLMAIRLLQLERDRVIASNKAEETTSLVGEQRKLISMLSHEFRTPLAVIQRSAEMLMLLSKKQSDDVWARLQRIQFQATKLARLVDIFLNKDGIDDKEFSLAREPANINDFMAEFVKDTSRADAKIILRCIDTEAVEAYIDEPLMALVMTNLVETSRRFARGTPIGIQVRLQNSQLAEISIPCQGEDLNDEEVLLIGNALFRRDLETKSLRNALGLHISQRIIDAHGGSIKLRDLGTNGIELCVLLPCEVLT